jgi:hypothetical protein
MAFKLQLTNKAEGCLGASLLLLLLKLQQMLVLQRLLCRQDPLPQKMLGRSERS